MSYLQKLKELNLDKITNEGLKNLITKNIDSFDESQATEKGKEQLKTMYEMDENKFPEAIKSAVEPKKEVVEHKKEAPVKKAKGGKKAKAKAVKKEKEAKKEEKQVKISSVNPKDNTSEVKKILEDEHYKVIVKTVGGGKRLKLDGAYTNK